MKVVLASDLEGVSCVDDWRSLNPWNPQPHLMARRHLTEDVNAAIRGLRRAGATDVLVIDGHMHGDPPSLLEDELVGGELVPRGPSAYEVIDGDTAAVALVGYHAMAGTPDGYLSHTVSPVTAIQINGRWIGETGLTASRAGRFGVPVVLVTGDAALAREAEALLPGIESAVVKTASSRTAVTCLSRQDASRRLKAAAEAGLRRRDRCAPFSVAAPVIIDVHLASATLATIGSMIPCSQRVAERVLRYEAQNLGQAVQFFISVYWLVTRPMLQETIAIYERQPALAACARERTDVFWTQIAEQPIDIRLD